MTSDRFFQLRDFASFEKLWDSPTAMTWLAQLTRALQGIVVVFIAFAYLNVEEVTVWLIFLTLISLQLLADMGFTPTFTRALSMAFAGSHDLKKMTPSGKDDSGDAADNKRLLNDIIITMRKAYTRLTGLATFLLAAIGSIVLIGPISHIEASESAWLAWGIIVFVSSAGFYGSSYAAFLQAKQLIPHLQRLRALTATATAISMYVALELDTGLLGLVFAHQVWWGLLVLQLRRSARKAGMKQQIGSGAGAESSQGVAQVFDYVWPATWRSALGILFGYAVIQSSGLIYAQIAPAAESATYLLILRLLQVITSFSQAPFYNKLPQLNRLWTLGDKDAIRHLAARGMRLSYWVYGLGVVSIGTLIPFFFDLVGASVSFPSALLWTIFAIAGFVERFGAMHIQIYTLTNHIVWHIANGITGLLFIIACVLFVPSIGLYGFASAYLVANLGFYAWYSARLSYKVLDRNFIEFDLSVVLAPLSIILLYMLVILLLPLL